MAQIVLVTGYADGSVFDPDGHNQNMHSVVDGTSIYGEANGRLDAGVGGNLAAGFEVLPEHVRPNGVVTADRTAGHRRLEFYSNGLSDAADDERTYVQAGDCGFTFDLEFDTSVVILQWQFFIHQWRHWYYKNAVATQGRPQIIFKAVLDGAALEYTRRPVASTAHLFDDTGGPPNHTEWNSESLAAQWWSMAAAVDSLGKGTHELSIRLFMEPQSNVVAIKRTIRDTEYNVYHDCHNRITFGVRSAGGIAFHYFT